MKKQLKKEAKEEKIEQPKKKFADIPHGFDAMMKLAVNTDPKPKDLVHDLTKKKGKKSEKKE